ncbi:MAG: N-acetylmuramoyl-L-alanine amidase, partial [bacterium]
STSPRDSVVIDSSLLLPDQDLQLRSGDYLEVMFKGTPGLQGTFSVPGLIERAPMTEDSSGAEFYWGESVFGSGKSRPSSVVEGIYRGGLIIAQGTNLDSAEIRFELRGNDGLAVKAIAPARLTVHDDPIPQIGELIEDLTVARTGPGLGYQMFLPRGVRLRITGKRGDYARAYLNELEDVWVPDASLNFLPPGTPIPGSTIELIRSENLARKVRLVFYLHERLPFKIEQSNNPAALIVSIYGAISNTDWIRYDFHDSMIRQITWSQPVNGVYQVKILFNHKQQWGYDPYYDGNNLILDIKKAPRKFSLKNLVVCVDPGHGPDDGAIGPTRTKEKDANLKLSLVLKEKLEKKGATVFLTRQDDHGAGLGVRSKLAVLVDADVFLSLHHNALPDGVNPFQSRGSSAYYYHPQSLALATAIQKRLLEKLKLPNFGLYYDNLSVCRITQMPSVLIESAFIMHPEEEMLIKTRQYRVNAADAIIKGLQDFMKQAKRE